MSIASRLLVAKATSFFRLIIRDRFVTRRLDMSIWWWVICVA